MLDLQLYRRQHRELVEVADRLSAGARAADARALLAELSGKLLVHLQMEDRRLYPELLRSEDPLVRETAARFQAELGSLRAAADAFSRRWLRPDAIEADPHAFSQELRSIVHALRGRIASEDSELFPAAERA